MSRAAALRMLKLVRSVRSPEQPRGKCWVMGCPRDPRGAYFCTHHHYQVRPEEHAAARLAFEAPVFVEPELQRMEKSVAMRVIADAILDRRPRYEREKDAA